MEEFHPPPHRANGVEGSGNRANLGNQMAQLFQWFQNVIMDEDVQELTTHDPWHDFSPAYVVQTPACCPTTKTGILKSPRVHNLVHLSTFIILVVT